MGTTGTIGANGNLTTTVMETIPDEDMWAYTPEHIAQIRQALNEGEGQPLSEADILRLMGE